MTTVAYRDGVLAADTLATSNGLRDSFAPKVWSVGDKLVGACGSRALCLKFREWVETGEEGDNPFNGKEDGNGFVSGPDGTFCYGEHGRWPVDAPFYALGTGYQLAMGAMEMGASAEEAVRVAIKWDTASGGDVTVLIR